MTPQRPVRVPREPVRALLIALVAAVVLVGVGVVVKIVGVDYRAGGGTQPQTKSAASLPTGNITVRTSADAHVQSGDPNGNRGGLSYLKVGNAVGGERRAYLRFEVRDVPPAVRAIHATLTMTMYENGTFPVSVTLGSSDAWQEKSLTWNSQPATDDVPVASLPPAAKGRTTSADVSSAITGNGIYTFALVASKATTVAQFGSRESGTPPALRINWNSGSASP
jgi:hypothetical protein